MLQNIIKNFHSRQGRVKLRSGNLRYHRARVTVEMTKDADAQGTYCVALGAALFDSGYPVERATHNRKRSIDRSTAL